MRLLLHGTNNNIEQISVVKQRQPYQTDHISEAMAAAKFSAVVAVIVINSNASIVSTTLSATAMTSVIAYPAQHLRDIPCGVIRSLRLCSSL